ncbi:amino acid carrier protein [Phaeocystidibacter luteus]|uniref:Amino acid carrier protein n=1 Tax=Phaeocystidibacter luteus TaxID=911197 RepID=A0A6N6RGZ3_9FLAO|nr:amino acid carrier protein [Phaeocystidibacter luteus]KAB2809735.1 amino acid carrier protein [Phaeocystidibacter luteus]
MKKLLLALLGVVLFGTAFAQQPLKIDNIILRNPEKNINNGSATAEVIGGVEPYTYYWSNQSTDTTAAQAIGLTEGYPYTLRVVDAEGNEVSKEFQLEVLTVAEGFNSTFKPIVDGVASVLLGDPFAALGLYDNTIYNDAGQPAKHPNGDIRKNSIPFIVIWLIMGALFFTIRMRFINIRGFKHAIDLARGRFDEPNAPGEVTHFQALATAVSATVGLGNIAGVAVAISVGGAGATFWMIVAGLLGMSSKFVECTLGVKYRNINPDGTVSGGPMHYLKKGLAEKKMGGLGKVLAGMFAVLAIGASFGGGNMFQANQAFAQLEGQFPSLEGKGLWFGIILMILVGVVIIGGIKSIAKVTEKIVPLMALTYIIAALVIIGINFNQVGDAFTAIYDGAFNAEALRGGFIGVLIQGFRRAAFSNEAGVGSAAIAHSAVKTKHPVAEGFVALLEPFIDTVVVCTLTALVLIFTGKHLPETGTAVSGAQMTSDAFGTVIEWFPMVLVIAIFLFAFSTMISWSYYGLKAWTYFFGENKGAEYSYKLIFLFFIVVGSTISLGAVLDFSDMMILAMSFPNIAGLLIMSGDVRRDLKKYVTDLKAGKIFTSYVKKEAK